MSQLPPNWRWLRDHATDHPAQAAQLTLATWLRETHVTPDPPVDVWAIAKWMDVDVEVVPPFIPNGEGWEVMKSSAMIDPTRERPLITLRGGDHPNHQRFSLAHELGHLMLHSLEHPHDRDMSVRNDDERDANQYAASLLMPRRWVDYDVYFGTTDPGVLARRYNVSQQAMEWRLRNLRLVP